MCIIERFRDSAIGVDKNVRLVYGVSNDLCSKLAVFK
jgi:hypothetical protein